jgi:hypothetical protein
MSRFAKLQFLGPAVVFLAVLMAEGAAFALAQMPTSETLWRANLEFFAVFQRSHYLLAPALDLPYAQLFVIAFPLLGIAVYGLLAGRDLALAIASNLSFVYAAFLIFIAANNQSYPLAASLTGIAVPTDPSIYLPLVLIGVSLISFFVSHCHYIRRIYAH